MDTQASGKTSYKRVPCRLKGRFYKTDIRQEMLYEEERWTLKETSKEIYSN